MSHFYKCFWKEELKINHYTQYYLFICCQKTNLWKYSHFHIAHLLLHLTAQPCNVPGDYLLPPKTHITFSCTRHAQTRKAKGLWPDFSFRKKRMPEEPQDYLLIYCEKEHFTVSAESFLRTCKAREPPGQLQHFQSTTAVLESQSWAEQIVIFRQLKQHTSLHIWKTGALVSAFISFCCR